MINEEKDMMSRIARLEDALLREKNFQEQLRMHYILVGYRKRLQELRYKNQGGG